MKLPKTAKEVREFIGSNFGRVYCANGTKGEPSDDDIYTLSAHDLISSFAEHEDRIRAKIENAYYITIKKRTEK